MIFRLTEQHLKPETEKLISAQSDVPGETMINWLAHPDRAAAVSAWSFLVGAVGFVATLIGLYLTYRQARDARISADQLKLEVQKFSERRSKTEAFGFLGEAKTAMEVAAVLIGGENWKDASSVYDDARKAIQKARASCSDVTVSSSRKLKLISEHLAAFSNQVDNAVAGKELFPDSAEVRATIRKSSDDLTMVQRELQEGI